ncbi:MAG: SUMF1/EgtB/PvdO family nonheme iron enzyme [Thermoguttaceae bacterium]|nr:SUMF1/EgtB/PvdO family nonheme iron enzyme [Thermoguttaceae bacterium]
MQSWNIFIEEIAKLNDCTTTAYHFGNNVTSRFINMQDRTAAFSSTRKVGSYLPNAWGLYACHGNVAEWCADWFVEFPEEKGISRTDPTGPLDGKGHVLRGRDLHSPPSLSRSAFRSSEAPLASLPSTGVRLAIYVPQKIETDMQEAITRQRSVVTTTRPITWKNAFGIPFQLILAASNTNNTNTRSENSTAASTASTDMPSPAAEPTSIRDGGIRRFRRVVLHGTI